MSWDVFISHASEDKADVARPLTEMLLAKGVRAWYDQFTLKIGDPLRQKIDHGLANSRYGVVILRPHFFEKKWTQNELDGLLSLESGGKDRVLPVWHNVNKDEVMKYSPMLAGRKAEPTTSGADIVSRLDIVTPAIVKKVCAYQVQNHHDQMVGVDVSGCEYHGEPIVPPWLASDKERLGSPWLVERLLAGTELRLYKDPKRCDGIWFVVDVCDESGVVINPNQLGDLKPPSATTTTSSTTTAPLPPRNLNREPSWN